MEVNQIIYNRIKNKFECNNFTVGVIGLGYVGLPLALSFCEKKINVIGFDINQKYLNKLSNGESYIHHIDSERISKAINKRYLKPTCNFNEISNVDAILICVPTPLNKHKEPDLGFIKSTLNSIVENLKEGQLLILESTTYPGTTDELIKPFIENRGLKVGKDFFLAYSPEREDPGNTEFTISEIPKILGGCTPNCSSLGEILYKKIITNIVVLSSTKAAEMTKLLENIYRAVNIGLINELKLLSDSLEIDIYEIIKAASTKPFGFEAFYPGPGIGGHCIPIDPFYLSWKAKEYGINLKFIELAGEINSSMPNHILSKITTHLNSIRKSIKNSKILVLGLSYKKNIDDLRESPSLKIIELLLNSGALVKYNDPFFTELPSLRNFDYEIENVEINETNLRGFDCVILCTDHDNFDYELIKNNSKFLLDTRGKFKLQKNIQRG